MSALFFARLSLEGGEGGGGWHIRFWWRFPVGCLILYHSRKLPHLILPILRLCREQGSLLWNPSGNVSGFSPHGDDYVHLVKFRCNGWLGFGGGPLDEEVGFVEQAGDGGGVGGMAGGGGNAGKCGGEFVQALGEGIAEEALAEFFSRLFIHGR